jgi:hypothetical protein
MDAMEDIMFNEVSQAQKDKVCMFSLSYVGDRHNANTSNIMKSGSY